MKIEETILMENQVGQGVETGKQAVDQFDSQVEQEIEWLSAAEAAARAGCSKQAVYNRMAKDLAPYCKEENGMKYLDSRAVKLISGGKNKAVDQADKQVEQAFVTYLWEEVERMREENADLKKAVAEKDVQILELAKKFADLAENEQKVAAMALAAEPPKLVESKVVEQADKQVEQEVDNAKQEVDQANKQVEQAVEPERKGFWGWIRKK